MKYIDPGVGKADDLHPVARTAAPRHYNSMFQRTNTFSLPVREDRQFLFNRNKKHEIYENIIYCAACADNRPRSNDGRRHGFNRSIYVFCCNVRQGRVQILD